MRQHAGQGLGAADPGGRADVLPLEQETRKVARLHRFDLAPQALERVAVDTRQQMPFTPLLAVRLGGKAALQHITLTLQAQQCGFDFGQRKLKLVREFVGCCRTHAAHARTQQLAQLLPAAGGGRSVPGRRGYNRLHPGAGVKCLGQSKAFGRDPQTGGSRANTVRVESVEGFRPINRCIAGREQQPCRTARLCQRGQPVGPAAVARDFRVGDDAQAAQAFVHLVRVARLGPGFLPHAVDRIRVEPAQVVGALRVGVAAALHRLGAALFNRRVVQVRIRPCIQGFGRERRRRGQVARDNRHLAGFKAVQQQHPALGVHRIVEAVVHGLCDQGMVGHRALAGQVLAARHLVREHRCQQILGLHALQLWRHFLAADETRQGQRGGGVPAPAHAEQRRVEQGLQQHVHRCGRVQVVHHFGQREAVAGGQ